MIKAFNRRQVLNILGTLLLIEAAFMGLATFVSLVYWDHDLVPLAESTLVTLIFGLSGRLIGKGATKQIGTREGYLIVSVVWIVFSIFGMLPFILDETIDNVPDAFFETMSGFTTTGATIMTNIDEAPKGLLFWRSLMQWLGGMGIVVFSMAVLPMFGSGMQVYKAETTGPTSDKIRPKVRETAQRLWGIYLLFTIIEAALLMIFGMNGFDAICHAMTTVSTGGFSTKQASMAYWSSPAIHYTIIVFMIISSINFTLIYNAAVRHQFKRLITDEEVKAFLWVIAFTAALVMGGLVASTKIESFGDVESNFRTALFNVVSLMTTTGYCTCDYLTWHHSLWIMIFIVGTFGGCAGSTAGGIKIIRMHIAIKNVIYEFRRIIHPRAIMPVRINGRVVEDKVVNNIHAFLVIFVSLIIVSSLVLMRMGMDSVGAISASMSCLSNVGPALGDLGPAGSFENIPDAAKWILSGLMLVGRLELFTVLLMFAPSFWKR